MAPNGRVCVLVERDAETGYQTVFKRFNLSEAEIDGGGVDEILDIVNPYRKVRVFSMYGLVEVWTGDDNTSAENWRKPGWRWYIGYRPPYIRSFIERYGFLAYHSECTYESKQECLRDALEARMKKCEKCENGQQCSENWYHDIVILEHVE